MRLSRLTPLTIFTGLILSVCSTSVQAVDQAGIVDTKGKQIVPCEYMTAKHLGQGLFLLTEIHPVNPTMQSYKSHIFDHDGKILPVAIPSPFTLDEVFLPPGFETQNKLAQNLPPETILKIHSERGFGLSRTNGNIIVKPEYPLISPPNGSFFTVYKKTKSQEPNLAFVVDSRTGNKVISPENSNRDWQTGELTPFCQEIKAQNDRLYGYLTRDGRVAVAPRFSQAQPFGEDGFAVVYLKGNENPCYIDKTGRVVSPNFRTAGDFKNGFAVAQRKTKSDQQQGIINKQFKFVAPERYYELNQVFPNFFTARLTPNGRFVAMTSKGSILFKFPKTVNSACMPVGNDIFCVAIRPSSTECELLAISRTGKIKRLPPITTQKRTGKPTPFPHSSDRWLKLVQGSNFYPEAFQHPNWSLGWRRTRELADLFHCYKVIGISREKLERLLGGNSTGYCIQCGMCANAGSTSVKFQYDKEKVTGWRLTSWPQNGDKNGTSPWITRNMEVIWPYDSSWSSPSTVQSYLKPKE